MILNYFRFDKNPDRENHRLKKAPVYYGFGMVINN